eukprot:comp23515_c1_seq1/m.39482 comp23515_c1_seq1/g.39482  ORF comp23515_c1_seq1/g.39482 comp23515_c1_seq1/m.39482 type:complete len:160 (-) comp23515_c1_seq1:975-1454(-)
MVVINNFVATEEELGERVVEAELVKVPLGTDLVQLTNPVVSLVNTVTQAWQRRGSKDNGGVQYVDHHFVLLTTDTHVYCLQKEKTGSIVFTRHDDREGAMSVGRQCGANPNGSTRILQSKAGKASIHTIMYLADKQPASYSLITDNCQHFAQVMFNDIV